MRKATAKTYIGKHCPKGHAERRVSNNTCAVCSRERANAYYSKNKDAVLERKKYHKKPDPEKKKEWNSKWLENNPSYFSDRYQDKKEEIAKKRKEFAEKNPELVKEWKRKERIKNSEDYNRRLREWKARNPGKVGAWGSKRRATLMRAIPPWADLKAIEVIYESCPDGYHVDHYYPLKSPTVCGLHCETNLRIISADENLRKHNRMPEAFYGNNPPHD